MRGGEERGKAGRTAEDGEEPDEREAMPRDPDVGADDTKLL